VVGGGDSGPAPWLVAHGNDDRGCRSGVDLDPAEVAWQFVSM
jgi:hypothetical protein